jgi:predicted phage terminase large subunit-like protein
MAREYLLLEYQQDFFADESDFIVWSKSRRIGASYAVACKSVMRAATGTHHTYYLSTRAESGQVFIADCVEWAKKLQLAVAGTGTEFIRDFDPETGLSNDVLAYSIRFANGMKIQALTSNPKNLRGLKGPAVVVCDEAAFHPDLEELLKAANAFLIWGGKVIVLSTHNGVGNPFNQLILDVRAGKFPGYSLHHTPFREAIKQGLYKRICLTQGIKWTQDKEDNFVATIYRQYGRGATEELDAVPNAGGAGFFQRDWFRYDDERDLPNLNDRVISARGYDLAATAAAPGKNPDWTVGIRGHLLRDGSIYIDDMDRYQASPKVASDRIRGTAVGDTPKVTQAFWEDPGAAGKFVTSQLTTLLSGFATKFERATQSKEVYAAPVSTLAEQRKIILKRAPWNDDFISELCSFPVGAHDDIVDAFSRLHMALTQAPWSFGYMSLPDGRKGPSFDQSGPYVDDEDETPSYSGRRYI